jgi:hypothetical protein
VGADLLPAYGRTDRNRHDEANSPVSQFCESAEKAKISLHKRLFSVRYELDVKDVTHAKLKLHSAREGQQTISN